jgi:hypothetical protein
MQNKKLRVGMWMPVLAVMLALVQVSCDNDSGGGGSAPAWNTGPEPEAYVPAFTRATIADKVIDGTEQKVQTLVYIEVNDDNPLNAMAYALEDSDTLLFNNVVLFAANIRSRNCAQQENPDHSCKKNGPHVHLNQNVQYILDNREKYITPLQEKGINVMLGLLGDHDGITFGSMNDTERTAFLDDVRKTLKQYGLDGVDFDDEWASKEEWAKDAKGDTITGEEALEKNPTATSVWVYPVSTWGWPYSGKIYRNPAMGVEISGVKAGNGTKTAPDEDVQNEMWGHLGAGYYKTIVAARELLDSSFGAGTKLISLYEYNSGRWITSSETTNIVDSTVDYATLKASVNFALQPWYSSYIDNSGNSLPHDKYSPFGMDLGGQGYYQSNFPMPPLVGGYSSNDDINVLNYAEDYKEEGDYGVLFFYKLEAEDGNKLFRSQAASDVPGGIPDLTRLEYLSAVTDEIFGQEVKYVSCTVSGVTTNTASFVKDWGK